MKLTVLFLTFFLLAAMPASAQLPPFYKNVHRITWVVKDVDAVASAWAKLGLTGIERHGETTMPVEYRGSKALTRIRWVSGNFGSLGVDLFEPVKGTNAWGEFLARRDDGVMSLLYLVPSKEEYEREKARLRASGVAVLQTGSLRQGGATFHYTYFDTAGQGKYVLGLMYESEATSRGNPASSVPPVRVTQFAFVVESLPAVSTYWKSLGFPEFDVTHPALTDLFFKGKSAKYEQDLGWQRHGSVPFEWCVPPMGSPTVYAEYLAKHGAGFQHIAFEVPDMDQAMAAYKRLGFETVQGGGWGEPGKPGSGRFGYVDTDRVGGLTIELLWNYREK